MSNSILIIFIENLNYIIICIIGSAILFCLSLIQFFHEEIIIIIKLHIFIRSIYKLIGKYMININPVLYKINNN